MGAGLAIVLAYAVGMGLLVGLLAVAVALARASLIGRLRAALPFVSRPSGVLLVLAGAYVAWYGWYEIRVLGGGSTEDGVVDAALRCSPSWRLRSTGSDRGGSPSGWPCWSGSRWSSGRLRRH